MRGICRSIVIAREGDWAATRTGAAATATSARTACLAPPLSRTLEAVIQSEDEAERLSHGDSFRRVQAETSPIHAQPEIGQPAGQRGQLAGGEMPRALSHQPCLAGVSEHYEVRPLEPNQGLERTSFSLLPRRVVRPVHRDVAPVLGLPKLSRRCSGSASPPAQPPASRRRFSRPAELTRL